MAAMFVPLNKEKAAMFVSQPNPQGIYYCANVFFCFRSKNMVVDHVSENQQTEQFKKIICIIHYQPVGITGEKFPRA